MPTYRVTAEFDLVVPQTEAVQDFANRWLAEVTAGHQVSGGIATTPQEVADYGAQNVRWAVSILVSQILATGAQQVYPGSTVRDLEINNNAPNGPA